MYKYSFSTLLLLLIVLCLSCEKKEEIEEPEFELPANPVEFPASARISSDILSGWPYNLANISFVAANGDKENTGSFNVDLLLDQDDYMANGVCAASIDSDDVVYNFSFTKPDNPTIEGNQLIRFNTVSGANPFPDNNNIYQQLRLEIFPLLQSGPPYEVYRQSSNIFLKCTACPISYDGRTYAERVIKLVP